MKKEQEPWSVYGAQAFAEWDTLRTPTEAIAFLRKEGNRELAKRLSEIVKYASRVPYITDGNAAGFSFSEVLFDVLGETGRKPWMHKCSGEFRVLVDWYGEDLGLVFKAQTHGSGRRRYRRRYDSKFFIITPAWVEHLMDGRREEPSDVEGEDVFAEDIPF